MSYVLVGKSDTNTKLDTKALPMIPQSLWILTYKLRIYGATFSPSIEKDPLASSFKIYSQ